MAGSESRAPRLIATPNKLKQRLESEDIVSPTEDLGIEVDRALAQMSTSFTARVADDLEALRRAGKAVETRATPAAIEQLYMCAHEFRGSGGSYGFQLVSEIANCLCDFLEDRTGVDPGEIPVIRLHVEAISAVLAQGIAGDGGDHGAEILAGLRRAVEKRRQT